MGSASDRRCSGCVQLALRSQPVLAAKAVNPDEMNSAVQVYMQLGPYGFRLRALQLLCQQILNEPLFNELRTEQQLGYSVHIAPSTSLIRCPALLLFVLLWSAPQCTFTVAPDVQSIDQRPCMAPPSPTV